MFFKHLESIFKLRTYFNISCNVTFKLFFFLMYILINTIKKENFAINCDMVDYVKSAYYLPARRQIIEIITNQQSVNKCFEPIRDK